MLPAGRDRQESLAARQAALVARAAAAVTAATEPDEVASRVVDQIMALGACAATLFVLDADGKTLRLLAHRNLPPQLVERLELLSIDAPLITARAARSGRIEAEEEVCVSGMATSLQRDLFEHSGCKSAVGVPLYVRECLLGVLGWSMPTAHHFTDEDRSTFAAIAEVFAVSLDRAATRAREQRLRAQVEAVRESVLDLSGIFDLRSTLQRIVDRARELACAEYAALGIHAAEGESFDPWVVSGVDLAWVEDVPRAPRARGLLGAVHSESKPLRVRDITQDPRFEGLPPGHAPMKSFLGVPILHLGRSVGDLFLSNKIGAVEFSEEDQRAMTLLAQHAAIAVEQARIHERMVEELGKRRRIEEALRKSEQRFRAIFDWTFQMAGLLSPEGILLEANRAFLSFFGVRSKQIIGRPFWEMPGWTMTARARLRAGIASAALGHFMREELELIQADGQMAWIDFSLKPMTDERGQVNLIIPEGREITLRKQAEAALREGEERFRLTIENAPIGMAIVGLDGRFVRVNQVFSEITGYPADELCRLRFQDITHPEDLDSDLHLVEQLTRGEIPRYKLAKRYIRKDGEAIPIILHASILRDAKGEPLCYIAQVEDVTERKRAEEERERLLAAVEAERRRLRAVFDNAPGPLVLFEHDGEGEQIMANPRAHDLLGGSVGREAGDEHAVAVICHPDGTPMAVDELPLRRALRGELLKGMEIAIRKTTGDLVPFLVGVTPLVAADGRVVGAVVAGEDISALKELERMREEWTGVVAHDLRQPISIIVFYAALLAKEPAASAKAQHILSSAKQMNRMIEDLLDVSRLESHRMDLSLSEVDLSQLLRSVVERSAGVTQGHPIRFALRGELPILRLDAGRIEQVLGNLLSNADKYGRPETQILLTAEKTDKEVIVAVSNEGEGIEAEELPKLFSRFRRTRRAKGSRVSGVGLGLYICKGLIEAHGGRIWATSIPGQTTTFAFALPISQKV